MMIKNISKIIISISIILLTIFSLNYITIDVIDKSTNSIAIVSEQKTASIIDDIFQGGDDFIKDGESSDVVDESQAQKISNTLYTVLLNVSIVLAIVVGMVLGIKYMISSVEEKAEVKGSLMIYFISCIVIFGGFGIWQLVVNILASI